MAVSIISLLIGMVLAQRFKVLALVPAMAVVILLAIAAEFARGAGLWPTALMTVLAIVSVQIGYLAGLAVRSLPASSRTSKLGTAFKAGAQRPASHHAQ
jgi:hypothetical protein